MEDSTQETISPRRRPQTVAMSQTEHLSIDIDQSRLFQTLHPEFLEIAVCPHVVISLEEIHVHSPVDKVCQSSEHPDITLWNNITILIPEIPDIPQKIQRCGFLRKRPEKIHETSLSGSRVIDLQSQMDIRHEICVFPVHLCKDKDCCSSKETVEGEPAQTRLLDKRNHHLAGKQARNKRRNKSEHKRERSD